MLEFPPVFTLSGEPLAHTGEEVGAPLLPLFDAPAFVPPIPAPRKSHDDTILLYEEGLCSDPIRAMEGCCLPEIDWRLTPRPEYPYRSRYLSKADRYQLGGEILDRIRIGAERLVGDNRRHLMRLRSDLKRVRHMYTTNRGIPEEPHLRRSTPSWVDLVWRKRNLDNWKYRIRQIRRRLFRYPRQQRMVFRVGLPIASPTPHRYRTATRTRREANAVLEEIRRGLTGRVFWPFRGAQIHAHILTGVFSHSTLVFAVALPRPFRTDTLREAIMGRLRALCTEPDLGIQFVDSQDYLRQLDVWSHPFVDGDPVELYHDALADYLLAERGSGKHGQPRCFNSRGILAPRTRRARRYPPGESPAIRAEVLTTMRQVAAQVGGISMFWLSTALRQLRRVVCDLRWVERMPTGPQRQLDLFARLPALQS